MVDVRIVAADLDNAEHQRAVLDLTDAYARDALGAGKPLDESVRARLIPGLRAHPTTIIFLAYVDGETAGIATCFRGFSSFLALPLINVHDLAVLSHARGKGVGRKLLEAVIAHGRALGCCKITLETQEHNQTAQRLYASVGFERAVHVPEAGGAIFMTCAL